MPVFGIIATGYDLGEGTPRRLLRTPPCDAAGQGVSDRAPRGRRENKLHQTTTAVVAVPNRHGATTVQKIMPAATVWLEVADFRMNILLASKS